MTAVLKLALIGSLAISVAADKDVVILSDADSSVRSMLASRASLAGVELGMDGACGAWDGARGFTPAADSSLPILAIDCRAEDSAIFAILVSRYNTSTITAHWQGYLAFLATVGAFTSQQLATGICLCVPCTAIGLRDCVAKISSQRLEFAYVYPVQQ